MSKHRDRMNLCIPIRIREQMRTIKRNWSNVATEAFSKVISGDNTTDLILNLRKEIDELKERLARINELSKE